MTDNLYWVLKLTINDGKLDDFKALGKEMSDWANENPDVLVYEWFLTDDNTTCHIYERFKNGAAALAYLDGFGSKYAERFMSMVTPTGFDVYGPADETVRSVLGNYGAVHFNQFAGFIR